MSELLDDARVLAGQKLPNSSAPADELPTVEVPLESLLLGDSPRRDGLDAEHANLLSEVPSGKLPPILIHRHTNRVIDGMHRLEAAKLRGDATISAQLADCDDDEAFLLAVRANTSHGLPLSLTDRVAAAGRILATHADLSDRAVAAIAGLDAKTVGSIRRRATERSPQLTERIGRDGKRRPVNIAEGRRRAGELLANRPTASLREIAKAAGISRGTAADVRDRVKQGMDPLPPRLRAVTGGAGASSDRKPSAPTRTTNKDSVAWPSVRRKLGKDPSLRYAESGRAFLQWMDVHATGLQEWSAIALEAIPPHWLDEVAALARSCGEEWHRFAAELERRKQETG